MEETVKKLIYTGVGVAVKTTSFIENKFNEISETIKPYGKDGKKVVKDLITKFDEKKVTIEERLKKDKEVILAKFNLQTKK